MVREVSIESEKVFEWECSSAKGKQAGRVGTQIETSWERGMGLLSFDGTKDYIPR